MGLGTFSGTSNSDSSSNSGSSSSSSSTSKRQGLSIPSGTAPDDFPIYSEARPQYVVRRTEDGLEFLAGSACPVVEMKATWYGTWEFAYHSPDWKKVWWDDTEFSRVKYLVQEEFDCDLVPLLKDNPERAVDVITKAVQQAQSEDKQRGRPHRDCAVCEEEIDLVYGSYEKANNRVLCDSHTVSEMKDADLL